VFVRLKRTTDIMTGAKSMRWFPESYEKKYLAIDALAEEKKKLVRGGKVSSTRLMAMGVGGKGSMSDLRTGAK